MKVKLARLGVLMASVLGLLGVTLAPAQAIQVGTVAFIGDAIITGGGRLGYPCTIDIDDIDIPGDVPGCLLTAVNGTSVTFKPGKLGMSEVNLTQSNGNTGNFGFGSTTCVGLKLTVDKPGKSTGAAGPLCSIGATGVVTGYCGLSSGTGVGFFTLGIKTLSFTFKFWDVGGTLIVSGTYAGAGAGDIKGVFEVIPDLPILSTTSCTNKWAIHFTIVGLATLLDLNI